MFERILELCQKRGISVIDLALHFGWSEKSIYNWKKSIPSADKLDQVAKYLGTTSEYLLHGSSSTKSEPQLTQFFRVDVSDLSDTEKVEFEEEMKAMSEFIAERIRLRRQKGDK